MYPCCLDVVDRGGRRRILSEAAATALSKPQRLFNLDVSPLSPNIALYRSNVDVMENDEDVSVGRVTPSTHDSSSLTNLALVSSSERSPAAFRKGGQSRTMANRLSISRNSSSLRSSSHLSHRYGPTNCCKASSCAGTLCMYTVPALTATDKCSGSRVGHGSPRSGSDSGSHSCVARC